MAVDTYKQQQERYQKITQKTKSYMRGEIERGVFMIWVNEQLDASEREAVLEFLRETPEAQETDWDEPYIPEPGD